jgi:hypothetical protein
MMLYLVVISIVIGFIGYFGKHRKTINDKHPHENLFENKNKNE